MTKRPLPTILQIILFGLAYFAVGQLGLLVQQSQGITPVWPPSGLALAVLLLFGCQLWPGIVVGILLLGYTVGLPWPAVAFGAVAQVLEGLAAAYFLCRFTHFERGLMRIKDVFELLLATLLAVMLSAAIGVLGFGLSGVIPWNQYGQSWLTWAAGDGIGVIVVTPLLLAWRRPFGAPLAWRQRAEIILLTMAGLLITWIGFGLSGSPFALQPALAYLPLPFIVWAAIRYRTRGVTIANTLLCSLAVFAGVQAAGPFATDSSITVLILQVTLIAVMSLTGLIVAAAFNERDAAHKELLESRENLRRERDFAQQMMHNLGQGVTVVDDQNQYEYVNPAFARMVGRPSEDVIGKTPWDFSLPEDYAILDEASARRQAGQVSTYEIRLKRADNTTVHVLVTGVPRWQDNQMTGSIAVITDLTERKQAEEMLRLVVAASPNAIVVANPQGDILFANKQVATLFSYEPEQLIGQPLEILIPERFRQGHRAHYESFYRQPEERPLGRGRDLFGRRDDGREFPIEIALSPFETKEETLVLVTMVDITERRRAEETLRQQEEHLRILVEQTPIGIVTVNMTGIVTDANPRSLELLGSPSQEATVGLNVLTLPPLMQAGISPVFERVLTTGQMEEIETAYTSIWGKIAHLFIRVVPHFDGQGRQIGLIILLENLTQRVQAEEALRQMQRLESLEVLSGGIAHDFNNLLVAMLGQTSLALAKMRAESPARPHVEKAVNAAEYAASLTQQLLAYSGRGHFVVVPLNLNSLIEENLHLFEATVSKNVHLRAQLAPEIPLIEADMAQIQQVVMNLIINAAEAIGDRPGTVLMVTGKQEVSAADRKYWQHSGDPLTPGTYVSLEVHDDGPGMDKATLNKIFDPFFTTKSKGHGLGLAAVLGIVKGHNGGLTVYSETGQGTTFKLLFPASDATQVAVVDAAAPEDVLHAGMVLVIDDEQHVREAVTDILALEEIAVLTAPDGKTGAALYRERLDEIGLVLLDLSMPGWSGERALRELRKINPDVRILLSSGYNQIEATRRFAGKRLTGFLQKPYAADQLVREVKRHLMAL